LIAKLIAESEFFVLVAIGVLSLPIWVVLIGLCISEAQRFKAAGAAWVDDDWGKFWTPFRRRLVSWWFAFAPFIVAAAVGYAAYLATIT
jgi:hypothetical protein